MPGANRHIQPVALSLLVFADLPLYFYMKFLYEVHFIYTDLTFFLLANCRAPSGKKYHTDSCRMVNNFSAAVSIEKARQLGLQPCLICRPQNIYNGSTTTAKTSGQAATVQCKGKTKAGTRCRHMTRIANGYCYQHQPE